jgi:hypothetical protein
MRLAIQGILCRERLEKPGGEEAGEVGEPGTAVWG